MLGKIPDVFSTLLSNFIFHLGLLSSTSYESRDSSSSLLKSPIEGASVSTVLLCPVLERHLAVCLADESENQHFESNDRKMVSNPDQLMCVITEHI